MSTLMPSCWDGANLDSADHRSHVAYPKRGEADGKCPKTHPVRLPRIAVFTRIAPYLGGVHLFSDGTGYFHADYFSGWKAKKLQKVLDRCENDSMFSAPNGWCEDHVTFRDAPKDEEIEVKGGAAHLFLDARRRAASTRRRLDARRGTTIKHAG